MKRSACCVAVLLANLAWSQVAVVTQGYDNGRTGANLAETQLNTSNVAVGTFGKLYSLPVDASIYAQPLYVPGVSIPANGIHNVLYVVTMNDSIYAFDADTNAPALWTVSLINPGTGITAVPIIDVEGTNSGNIVGTVGIESTPVIDMTTGTMYLVARTKENGSYVQRLHAIDITNGQEKFGGPVTITGSVPGTSGGGPNVAFNPRTQNQRPSLALANGLVLIAWASHADIDPYHGWVMAYNAATLQQSGIFNDTPDGRRGGIWQSGRAPVIDSAGNAYFFTGNGDWNGTRNFGESILKFSTTNNNLVLADWFTPDNFDSLNLGDKDVGSSGPLLIPGTDLLVGGGKEAVFYLVHSANLGHEQTGNGQIVQHFVAGGGHIHPGPVYWQSPVKGPLVYVWTEFDRLRAYHFNGTNLDTTPLMMSTVGFFGGMPGGTLSVSANGSAAGTGIVWAHIPVSQDANSGVVPGIVRAFDASNLTHEIWNSQMNIARDDVGLFAKFVPPVVVNGKLYMATFSNYLTVYGLLATDFSFSATPGAQGRRGPGPSGRDRSTRR